MELKIFNFFVCIGIFVKRLGVKKNKRFCNIKAKKNGAHSICKIVVKSVNNLEISTRTLTLTGVVDDELISVANLGSH